MTSWKIEVEPIRVVFPADDAAGVLQLRRLVLDHVRLAEHDEDFAAIAAPAGEAGLAVALVGDRDAGEVLVERLVLGRGRIRIGGLDRNPARA